jgi:hypothetical protein
VHTTSRHGQPRHYWWPRVECDAIVSLVYEGDDVFSKSSCCSLGSTVKNGLNSGQGNAPPVNGAGQFVPPPAMPCTNLIPACQAKCAPAVGTMLVSALLLTRAVVGDGLLVCRWCRCSCVRRCDSDIFVVVDSCQRQGQQQRSDVGGVCVGRSVRFAHELLNSLCLLPLWLFVGMSECAAWCNATANARMRERIYF